MTAKQLAAAGLIALFAAVIITGLAYTYVGMLLLEGLK